MILTAMFKKCFGASSVYKEDDGSTRITADQYELTLGRSYHPKLKRKVGRGFGFYVENGEKLEFVLRGYWFVLIAWSKKRKSLKWEEAENAPTYGFNVVDSDLAIYLGNESAKSDKHISMRSRSKYIPLPWAWVFHKREVLTTRDTWADVKEGALSQEWSFPATYVTKHNEVQEMMIEAKMERMTWRLAWLPWFVPVTKKDRSASYKYHGNGGNGVGHDASGWKGGVIGGGVIMRDNEHNPKETFDRLIKEQHYG
jgi:hypothetical protein